MAITDFITFFLSIFFLNRGFSRGFMHSLINPFSIIATTIFSIIYYQNHPKDWMISLSIGLIGPLLLTFLFKILLRTWATATKTDTKPGLLSCLGGAILTLAWGWVFIILALILSAVLPSSWGKKWEAVHNDVTRSVSYERITRPLQKWLFDTVAASAPVLSKKVSIIFSAASKQKGTAAPNNSSLFDAKSLAEDPRFQAVLQDPEVQKEIDAHDIVKLMGNPKMIALTQQIMSDPATMKKVMGLYSSQMKSQAVPGLQTAHTPEPVTSDPSN